jgi:hypothetical protein
MSLFTTYLEANSSKNKENLEKGIFLIEDKIYDRIILSKIIKKTVNQIICYNYILLKNKNITKNEADVIYKFVQTSSKDFISISINEESLNKIKIQKL